MSMGIKEELEAAQEIQQINIRIRRAWGTIFKSGFEKYALMLKYQRKQLLTSIALIASLGVIIVFGYKLYLKEEISATRVEQVLSIVDRDSVITGLPKENIEFMYSVAQIESGGNFSIVGGANNKYWGAFQFGPAALDAVGLKGIDKNVFLRDTTLQIWAMNQLMIKNYKRLSSRIEERKIPLKGGVRIGRYMCTVSGLLAASHLVGVNGVIKFIDSNGSVIAKDGNGVPLTDYLQLNNFALKFGIENK